ncbi:hypothetical protein [Amycolatopsis taiwanensis]|uniref:hypothetical protein n=1 Tax=Amycolatopsis taiwanensis TaxID=342230 RepID=UPI000482727E|nr:hypothetical protein [Amycolatopsis taiwanensis]
MNDLNITVNVLAEDRRIVAIETHGAYKPLAHCGSAEQAEIVRAALAALAERSPDVLRDVLFSSPRVAVVPSSPLVMMPPDPDHVANWLEALIESAREQPAEVERTWTGELTLTVGGRTFIVTVREDDRE